MRFFITMKMYLTFVIWIDKGHIVACVGDNISDSGSVYSKMKGEGEFIAWK